MYLSDSMKTHVCLEIPIGRKGQITLITLVWLFAGVDAPVDNQLATARETLAAIRARKRFLACKIKTQMIKKHKIK